MTMNIPDGMPSLSAGDHEWDEGMACAMEYVSVLAGEAFSDSPRCTHPVLACATRYVNDRASDADRHLIIPLLHRLASAGKDTPGITDALFDVLNLDARDRRLYHPLYYTGRIGAAVAQYMTNNILNLWWINDTQNASRQQTERGVELITRLLDTYERVAGATPRQISDESLAKARELIQNSNPVIAIGAQGILP